MTVGGIGGVTEGLYHGLPELCFPSHFEQRENCLLLERAGVGLRLDKDNFSAEELTDKFRFA